MASRGKILWPTTQTQIPTTSHPTPRPSQTTEEFWTSVLCLFHRASVQRFLPKMSTLRFFHWTFGLLFYDVRFLQWTSVLILLHWKSALRLLHWSSVSRLRHWTSVLRFLHWTSVLRDLQYATVWSELVEIRRGIVGWRGECLNTIKRMRKEVEKLCIQKQ